MTPVGRIVAFVVVPVFAAALVGATFATSGTTPARALVVYGPKAWARGRPVPIRMAVFGADDATERIREAWIRAGKRTLAHAGAPSCETALPELVAPRSLGRVTFVARTDRGTAEASTRVRLVDRPASAPSVVREGIAPARAAAVRIDAFATGGSIAVFDPLPVHLRFTDEAAGRPWAGEAGLEVRIGGLQTPAPRSVVPDQTGFAAVSLAPLLTDLHVELTVGGTAARMVLPVRPARPTVHVADPTESRPVRSFEVHSQSGARCAYVDLLVDGARRSVLSAKLEKGVARFEAPQGVAGLVAIQASTHFAEQGDAVTVRHAWLGPWIDVALGEPEGSEQRAARFASMDAVRFPPEVLVDGGDAAGAALRARRAKVRTRAVYGIVLCALTEAIFLGQVGVRARRRAREIEDAAARETQEPAKHGSDWLEIVAFVAAAAAAFAALAAFAGLLP